MPRSHPFRRPRPLGLLPLALLLGAVGARPVVAQAPAPSAALAPAPAALSLAEAVQRAGTVAPAAQLAAGRRAERVGRARTEAQWGNPLVELRRENLDSPLPYDDFATVTLPVSLTGRRVALRSALGATREQARADSVATIRDAQYAAARAWWGAWAARSIAAIVAEQAEVYARVARIDSLRASEGEISEAAGFRMRIEAQRARHDAARAAADAAHAGGLLAALVGEGDPARLAIVPEAPPLDALPAADAALAAADRDRPDLAAARAAERAAERRRTAERLGTLPDVGVTGGYKGTSGLSTTVIGLLITPPLLNQNGGGRERASGEWLLANADRRAAELRVRTEVRAALEAAHAIDAGTAGFDTAFAARATVVSGAAEAAYREGAASLLELLDAFRAAADARVALVRGTLDRALARLDLRRATGAPAVEMP